MLMRLVRELIQLALLNVSSSSNSSLLLSIFLDRVSSAHVSMNHADEEQEEQRAPTAEQLMIINVVLERVTWGSWSGEPVDLGSDVFCSVDESVEVVSEDLSVVIRVVITGNSVEVVKVEAKADVNAVSCRVMVTRMRR